MRAGRPAVNLVLVVVAIDALGFGIVIPIVPNLVQALSGEPAGPASLHVGALVATFAAAQFLLAPVLGGLSDSYGRRTVILISITGVAANYLLLTWAPSLPWLFLGRFLAGATAANFSAANAYIADVTPPEERARRFGQVGAVFGAAFVLGPAIGGLAGAVWLRLPFLLAAGLAGCNALYGLFLLPESLPPERRRAFAWRRANPVGSFGTLAADGVAARLGLAWCCMWFALGSLQSVFVLFTGLRLGWGPGLNGSAMAAIGVTQAVVQGLLVRRVVGRLGERRTAMLGQLFSLGAYLMFAFTRSGCMIYAAVVLQGCGSMANPAVNALLSARAGPDRQGAMQGALAGMQGLTAIASPLVAATLFARFAGAGLPGAPFLLAACMFLFALLLVRKAR
ncbi:MAG: MFS transporter [Acidisphaera sp.]|nr:MFS transporter [Acidisphaera sp.]